MRGKRAIAIAVLAVGVVVSATSAADRMYDTLSWDVGIRDVYLRGLGEPDVWTAAKAIGVKRLEVVVDKDMACPGLFEGNGTPYRVDTTENRKKLMAALAKHGVSVSCFCAVVGGKGAPSQSQIEWITRVAEAAGEMKVPVIMMPLGYGAKTDEEYLNKSAEFFNALAPVAKRTGVTLTFENLGRDFLNRKEIAVPLCKAIAPGGAGIANDITNMYWYGHPIATIYELAKAVAPYVRYVHVKNVKYPAEKKNIQRSPGWQYGRYAEPVRTGDIDFKKIITIYAAAGFKGDLTIEDDSLGKFDAAGKKRALIDDVTFLREIIQGLGK